MLAAQQCVQPTALSGRFFSTGLCPPLSCSRACPAGRRLTQTVGLHLFQQFEP
jgi:hypothetical protein